VLDSSGLTVIEARSSRRAPLSDAEAAALLRQVDEVVIARGRSSRTLPAAEVAVDDLRGPTGNLRAPMVRRGRRLLVGFHAGELDRLLE
jgi:hypothetical protein